MIDFRKKITRVVKYATQEGDYYLVDRSSAEYKDYSIEAGFGGLI